MTILFARAIESAVLAAAERDRGGEAVADDHRQPLKATRGYHALVQVVYELQQDGQYSDDEGEETEALRDLINAIESAPSPAPAAVGEPCMDCMPRSIPRHETVGLIVRSCCEAEPSDPDHPDTVCINVIDLEAAVATHLDAVILQDDPSPPPPQHEGGSDADRQKRLLDAARTYFNDYCLDEAAGPAPLGVPMSRVNSHHLVKLYQIALSHPPAPVAAQERLHTFLNAAAGDGWVFDGVDAADLYKEIFPERFAAAVAGIDSGTGAPQ